MKTETKEIVKHTFQKAELLKALGVKEMKGYEMSISYTHFRDELTIVFEK